MFGLTLCVHNMVTLVDRPDIGYMLIKLFGKHLVLIDFDLNLSKDVSNCVYDRF